MLLRNFTDLDVMQLRKYEKYSDMSIDDLQALIEDWNKKKYNDSYFEMFAIVENDVIIGEASLFGRSEHIVSCGLVLYPEFQGKGYGAHAYRNLLLLAMENGFSIAVAQVRADNTRSIALHKKVGFEAEDYTYTNKKGNQIYYFIKSL